MLKFEEKTCDVNKYVLSRKITEKYDMITTKKNVMLLLSEYLRLQYKYLEISPPKITYNYEIKSDYQNKNMTDNLSYYLDKKLKVETEIKAFYFEIEKVLKNMTREELIVTNYLLLKGNSEESVCEILGLSRTGLRPIKNSCILKIALAFNLEKLK